MIANLRNLPGEQCSPLHGYAAISELRLDSSTTAPAGPSLRMTRPDNQTKQSQVGVEAGIARAVAASAATYLGVPLGTQGFKGAGPAAFQQMKTRKWGVGAGNKKEPGICRAPKSCLTNKQPYYSAVIVIVPSPPSSAGV